jgi:hypothetical protein
MPSQTGALASGLGGWSYFAAESGGAINNGWSYGR